MTSSLVEGKAGIKQVKGEEKTAPQISFQKVSFSYPKASEYALGEISFEVKEGERVGIIGGTGSGKSTLVQLLPRLYDVSAGDILLEGHSIKDYSFEALRSYIGLVPQKSVLFYGSIRDNLMMSRQDATEEEIIKAIEVAQAADFIEQLPEKLDTIVLQGVKDRDYQSQGQCLRVLRF